MRVRFNLPAVRVSVLAAMLVALGSSASAATFNVSPTQLFLSGRDSSTLLTLRNETDQPLRFQLSVFAWEQSPSGEMVLTPTQDVVFFPALVTLNGHEERKVRVGRVTPPAAVEKTYRIFVEELPSLEAASSAGSEVKVLTKMGVPIFVRPAKDVTGAAFGQVAAADGMLRFDVANVGTVHFVPDRVTVRGLKGGEPVVEKSMTAWYVLPGGRREFELALGEFACAGATSLQVEAVVGSTTLDRRLELPSGAACGR